MASIGAPASKKSTVSRKSRRQPVPVEGVHIPAPSRSHASPVMHDNDVSASFHTKRVGHKSARSEITSWSESEGDAQMHISSASEGNEAAEGSDDPTEDESASVNSSGAKDIERTGTDIMECSVTSESSAAGRAPELDEDVRILVVSTPE